ncbi:MAG: Hsp70 family protein [Anaerolineaceae bacterium]|nr:Hsp70 family protein [Anaerolineaceae bacterium]
MQRISAIGIDLGTTFSSVSYLNEHGEPEIITNSEGERLTPSVVFFDESSIVVGEIAKENALTQPEKVVMFVKREMGNPNWSFTYQDKTLTPVEISALILKKLKGDAEQALNQPINNVVITVPAYFDDSRRRATIAAGELAKFKVLKLINEPTAAAIAFGATKSNKDETVLIYDLGGGTFDATLMRVENGGKNIRIIASEGDHQLGGKDFDDAIINICVEAFKNEHGFDPTDDPLDSSQIRQNAEKAKKELSVRSRASILARSKGYRSQVIITREEFDEVIKPKVSTTSALIRTLLRSARVKKEEIDRVLMIGGSTRIPLVRNTVEDLLNIKPDVSVNPDEAVSLGAAIVASMEAMNIEPEEVKPEIEEKIGALQITDVVSHSIGIEAAVPGTNQKLNSILIKKNSPIPVEISKEFVTQMRGQTGIQVKVYQGEFQNPALCNPIGDFILSGLPPGRPPGKKVRVTLSCSTNGVIEIFARDIESGIEMQTKVDYAIGLATEKLSAKKLWMQSQVVE